MRYGLATAQDDLKIAIFLSQYPYDWGYNTYHHSWISFQLVLIQQSTHKNKKKNKTVKQSEFP